MLRIELLPADQGDALLIEYGDGAKVHRMLIDGGPCESYEFLRRRLLALAPADRHFELLIVTHVDSDHIEGVVRLLLDRSVGCSFRDIWLNDWPQVLAMAEGVEGSLVAGFGGEKPGFKFLCVLLEKLKLPVNKIWEAGPIVIPMAGPLPMVELPGGMRLTLLAPEPPGLFKLHRYWSDVVNAAGFALGDEKAVLRQLRALKRLASTSSRQYDQKRATRLDKSVANGSSIAVLAEYGGHRVLLAGDAPPGPLIRSLQRWIAERGKHHVTIDAFKLPHHGSRANIVPELLMLIRCRHYLVSTSGRLYGHPHPETMDMLLKYHRGRCQPVFHFNYRTRATARWASISDRMLRRYKSIYASPDRSDVLELL